MGHAFDLRDRPMTEIRAIRRRLVSTAISALILAAGEVAFAGEADVEEVTVRQAPDGRYSFSVTVRHGDEGWEHYANVWQVLAPDGTILGERVLLHPHETEQPFTRSLSGVAVPDGVGEVTVRAGDLVHGFGGKTVTVSLPGPS